MPYGTMWRNGRQEIDLPLPRQRGFGNREADGPERQQGLRKRPHLSDNTA